MGGGSESWRSAVEKDSAELDLSAALGRLSAVQGVIRIIRDQLSVAEKELSSAIRRVMSIKDVESRK